MLSEHPWVGIGRGAFESVSPAHQPLSGRHVRFTHAEIFPMQWAIEWGIPVAAAALLAFAFLLRPSRLRSKATTAGIGLYVGVIALLVQNLFDLALEVPGVMVAVACAVGTISTVSTKGRARRRRRARIPKLPKPVTLVAATAWLLALGFARRDLVSDRATLRHSAESLANTKVAMGGFPEALRAATLRHPAEPYFPLLGALVAFHRETGPVMPWIQRSLERGMNDGRVHLLLAHLLARRGVAHQALLELRLAAERDSLLSNQAARLAVALTREPSVLVQTVPEGEAGLRMLEALATQLHAEGDSGGETIDRMILDRDDQAVEARVRVAHRRIADMEDGGPCADDPTPCVKDVEAHAEKLAAVSPDSSSAVRVRARLLDAQGEPDAAARLLVDRCDQVSDRPRCWRVAVGQAAKASDPKLLSAAAEKILANSCADRARCARTAQWLGSIYATKGHWTAAMMYYQRAMSEESSADRLMAYAHAAKQAGAKEKARRALQRALTLHADRKDEIRERLEKLR
jgi:tetratricopeptide (TPR) repeat protein